MKNYFLDFESICFNRGGNIPGKIIQVGMVSEDGNSEFLSLARPSKNFKINAHCNELTGLTKEEVKNAPYRVDVLKRLASKIKGPHIVWTWGEADIKHLEVIEKNTGYKFPLNVQDLQEVVCREFGVRTLGLRTLYVELSGNEPPDIHNALEDAEMLRDVYKVYSEDKERFKGVCEKVEFEGDCLAVLNKFFKEVKGLDKRWKGTDYLQDSYVVLGGTKYKEWRRKVRLKDLAC